MRFTKHEHLEGQHSFLSPSSYHWINYDEEKLHYRWKTIQASLRGTEDHRFAAVAIAERDFQDNELSTLGLYINQSIQYKLHPEVVLYYSPNCFGTADAIAFRYKTLRISDLKTGITKTSEHQLEVYAAIFCLEYGIDPFDIKIELRIYQDNVCRPYDGDPGFIKGIMDKIVLFDEIINRLREEAPK